MQPCPRTQESFRSPIQTPHWRDDGTCSYCGSISPEMLFNAIETGVAILGATDKNYKVYVDLPEPDAGQPWIYSTANYEFKPGIGIITEEMFDSTKMPPAWKKDYVGKYGKLEPKMAIWHAKFYFQHFSEEDKHRFIKLFNEQKIKFDGGSFYVMPFFMKRIR